MSVEKLILIIMITVMASFFYFAGWVHAEIGKAEAQVYMSTTIAENACNRCMRLCR